MNKFLLLLLALAAGSAVVGCSSVSVTHAPAAPATDDLTGAWRSKVQFAAGSFAAVKDLEFMYLFNAGGTMTESSNYDSAPPVPPAYGVWRKTSVRHYEARYAYYWTKSPASFDDIAKGGGWSPGGIGIITQKISLSADGRSFDSTLTYEAFDQQGKSAEPASVASATATRIQF